MTAFADMTSTTLPIEAADGAMSPSAGPPSAGSQNRRTVRLSSQGERQMLWVYGALLFGSALDGFALGPLPIQWLVQVGAIAAACWCFRRIGFGMPNLRLAALCVLWTAGVTAVSVTYGDYAAEMPIRSTTPYLVFVSLRVLSLGSFFASIIFITRLLRAGLSRRVVDVTVKVAVVVAVLSLYVYASQVLDLPQLPRSRIGTDGLNQGTSFTYAFHRATGTFREPAYLAGWLVVPLLMSFSRRTGRPILTTILLGSTLVLTGSLGGIASVTVGLFAAFLLASSMDRRALVRVGTISITVTMSLVVFQVASVGNGSQDADVVAVISDRASEIISGGLESSDRGYIYRFSSNTDATPFGIGLGNANILLASTIGSRLMPSFNHLYLNLAYSVGAVGVTLFAAFLVWPLIVLMVRPRLRRSPNIFAFSACYVGWLVLFASSFEEFTLPFAVAYSLLCFEVFGSSAEHRPKRAVALRSNPNVAL